MHTPSGEAFKDNTPPLPASAAYFDGVWAKTIYSSRPVWWMVDAQPCSWQVSHLRNDRLAAPLAALCAAMLMFLDSLTSLNDPVCPPYFCKYVVRTCMEQSVVKILYEQLCDIVVRCQDDRMDGGLF